MKTTYDFPPPPPSWLGRILESLAAPLFARLAVLGHVRASQLKSKPEIGVRPQFRKIGV